MQPLVLYIEDNPDNIALVLRSIELLNCQVLWATNGREGLQLAENNHPDLILLDINLPDIDGYEIARRVRSSVHPRLASVPMIAVTANAMRGDAERAYEAGCNAYMAKPISPRELRKQVAAFLPAN
jgi:two-component system cell cycle response regulator DivK